MLRRAVIAVPLAAAAAAAAAAALDLGPAGAAAIGLAAGLLVVGGLASSLERRVNDLTAELRDTGRSLRRHYDELTAERERVERLLDALPTAVLLFEPDRMSYANPAGQAMFGVRRRESRSPLQVLGVEALADAVGEVRATGRNVELEVQRTERHLTAHVAATGDAVVALLATDVTDARRVEAIRRDFVTNASHELKTPVAGMRALAESLGVALDRDPDRARSMIGRMEHEAERLATLVRDLLDLARLEEAAAPAGRRRVDMAHVVKLEADRVAALAKAGDVRMIVHADEPAWLVAVPDDLHLIVSNLLENAIRYNRRGGRVDVRVERTTSSVVLEVADDGIGIPEAHRDRVFERFYRVDQARSRAAGGTGLGLAIVRHAAQRHGGDVTVSSVLAEGSTFRVVLPVEGGDHRS